MQARPDLTEGEKRGLHPPDPVGLMSDSQGSLFVPGVRAKLLGGSLEQK